MGIDTERDLHGHRTLHDDFTPNRPLENDKKLFRVFIHFCRKYKPIVLKSLTVKLEQAKKSDFVLRKQPLLLCHVIKKP